MTLSVSNAQIRLLTNQCSPIDQYRALEAFHSMSTAGCITVANVSYPVEIDASASMQGFTDVGKR
jgi:hypothetical protein